MFRSGETFIKLLITRYDGQNAQRQIDKLQFNVKCAVCRSNNLFTYRSKFNAPCLYALEYFHNICSVHLTLNIVWSSL